jgi:hypothetical protein
MYFDASDVGLSAASEDIDSVSVSAGNIFVSTAGAFSVPGLSGEAIDVFVCNGPTTGPASACASFGMFFDGSASGITSSNLNAFDLP